MTGNGLGRTLVAFACGVIASGPLAADADPAVPPPPPPTAPTGKQAPPRDPAPGSAKAVPVVDPDDAATTAGAGGSGAHGGSEAIAFEAAIARAMAHATDLRVAIAEIERADGLLVQATSALLPQLTATATYTRIAKDRYVADQRIATANTVVVAATLTAPILDLRAIAERHRARDQLEVTADEANRVRRDVAIATARAYFSAFSTARMREIAEHARDTARVHRDFAAQRHATGVGNELDVARAGVELASDEAQVASARSAQLRAEEALGVLVGGDHALAAAVAPALEQDGARGEDGIARRADVVAALRRRDAATASRRLDWTDYAPRVDLTLDGTFTEPRVVPEAPLVGWGGMVVLTVPLFDGFYRHGTHLQHLAIETEEVEKARGTTRQATSEVRTASAAVGDARTAAEAAHRAADLGAKTLELAEIGFKAGTSTGLEVIDAERAALDAASRALIADDELREAQLDLLAATGAFPH